MICWSTYYFSLFTFAFLCYRGDLVRIALIDLVIASIFSIKEGVALDLGPVLDI